MSKTEGDAQTAPHLWYQYRNFRIALPANHLLPTYQKQHPLYDRFLPHLAKYLGRGSLVIDVGANCGDTVAPMYDANPLLNYVCIEPDEGFFELLNFNVSEIKKFDRNAAILTIKALIGKNIASAALEGQDGTKHAVPGGPGQGVSSQKLDTIFSTTTKAQIRLLKTDVDGFDYDVIESAEATIQSHSPLIFFECQFDQEAQKESYKDIVSRLHSRGYRDWALFNNFGQLVLSTDNLSHVFQLFEYVWRQNIKRATRTIYYFDVLASVAADAPLVAKVLADYRDL